jgi:hypothetical protein
MSIEANNQLRAEGLQRPVFAVPVIWKLQFTKNVSGALKKEMRQIEKKLKLPVNEHLALSNRFYALQNNILEKQQKVFGYQEPAEVARLPFFERQDRFRDYLISKLEEKYGKQNAEDVSETVRLLGKAIRKVKETDRETFKADSKIHEEIERLGRFQSIDYGHLPELTQEHIAENLKRIKHDLFKFTTLDAINRMMPRPAGPRVAHIRVGTPINSTELMGNRTRLDETERDQVVETFRQRMQGKIDEVNRLIAPQLKKFSHPNPFYNEKGRPPISVEVKPAQ